MFYAVFPNKALSQTITSYEEQAITNPSADYSTPDYKVVAEWIAQNNANSVKLGFCSCVTFVKRLTGYDQVVGAAKNWPTNSEQPQVGGVVVLNESKVGHVAYITAVGQDSFTVAEANYISCEKSNRVISLNDPAIMGFWTNN